MEQPEAQTMPSAPYAYDVHTVSHAHVVVTPKPVVKLYWRIGPVSIKSTPSAPPTPTPQSESRAEGAAESEITVQLTADQQVALSISGEDKYDNPVSVSGDVAWWSSDEAIVQVFRNVDDNTKAIAVAVGPVGTAAITVSNDFNQDGTGDFQGSLAIDVVAGEISEIVVNEGEVSAKPAGGNELPGGPPPTGPGSPDLPDNTLPGGPPPTGPGSPDRPGNALPVPPGTEVSPPRPGNSLPGGPPPTGPGTPDRPDNSLPGGPPPTGPGTPDRPDNSLPGGPPPTGPGSPDRPDNALPGGPPNRPDAGLPGNQPGIDNELPGGPPNRPDAGLPGEQPGIDNEVPDGPPNRPDAGLPDTPQPKGRRR